MASPVTDEDRSSTKTDEETTAFHKKRTRRVSFAENTSVHFFDRDESFETPSDHNPPTSPNEDGTGSSKFFRNEEDEDDDDELGPRSPFLRVFVSPSSGGSTIGSVTSNDEDNFFGPVSTSFIRRDLSDSAASDIHDQTMDSTSFSMHFHSIARSESEGEMKTSTGVHLSFEEKTPTLSSNPYNTKSSMKLTLVNKPNSEPDVSTSKSCFGSQSNDMSLVGEYHDKYDYGKISPALEAFLAEGSNDLYAVSDVSMIKSPPKVGTQLLANKENESDVMDFSYGQDNKVKGIHEELNEHVSVKHNEMYITDDGLKPFGVLSNNASDTQVSKHMSPNQSIRGTGTFYGINSSLNFFTTPSVSGNMVYQLNDAIEKENRSPLIGSITEFADRPSHLPLNAGGLFKSPGTVTPSNYQASASPRTGVSSLQRSISKLRILEASPFSTALSAKLEDSNSRSLFGISKMTPLGTLLEKNNKFPNMDDNKVETPKNPVLITRKENFVEVASQLVLPSEENMQPNLLNPTEKSGSPQTVNCSSKKLKKATKGKFRVSPYRYDKQHNETLKSEPDNAGGLEESLSITRLSTPLNVVGSNITEMVHSRKEFLYDIISNSETRANLKTLSNDIEHGNIQPVFGGSDITMGLVEASLALNGMTDEKSFQTNLADQSGRSPSHKELPTVLNNGIIDSLHVENVQSSARKRKTEDATATKIAKIKTTSDTGLELPIGSGVSRIGPNPEHLSEIDRLVDILGHLQRSKTYQLLSCEIQSQRNVEPSSITYNNRVAESKLLLCKFVHEQAKGQLMHVKRERLLKNAELLASGIQESEMLKLKHTSQNLLDAQVINQKLVSDNIKDVQECQVENDKVTSMKQEIKDIDERISNLTKSFHISCKMKGEPKPADAIALVNDQLMKRARCQILRKDMQLWVLDDLKSSKDHHDVVLNYLDLMFQRFTVSAGVVPSISISTLLNEMNIQKKFKDMEALTAFGFVFDAGLEQKHIGATSLAQETQITSCCLGNLVDVMREIQLAKRELKNLVHARFCTSLDEERLDLELCFIDSNSRKKATVTLNTSCLKSGIYPSEVAVGQIDIPVGESQSSSSQTLSEEIEAAVQDLRVGFFRILRLCRCISRLLGLQGKN